MTSIGRAAVAVLIPVHNDQLGLDRAVASLANQNVSFDIIVIDDGSAPSVVAPVHPGVGDVTLLRLDQNVGLVTALNTALAHVRTTGHEFIARLDAGDAAHPMRLQRQLMEMKSRPNLMLLGSSVRLLTHDGTQIGAMRMPTGPERIRDAIHYRACFVHPSVMMRSRLFDKIGLYDPRYKQAQDYDLFMRATTAGLEVDNISDPLTDYFVTDFSISTQHSRRQTFNILRTCLAHFRPFYWGSYFGILRRFPNLVLSREQVIRIKAAFRVL